MKSLITFTLFLLLPFLVFAQGSAYVSGVYSYDGEWVDLPGVGADITSVADALKFAGFETEVSENITKDEFISKTDKFFDKSDDSEKVIFYFAGHGYSDKDGNGYIVLKGAPASDEEEALKSEGAVALSYFIEKAKSSKADQMIFIFDSCFSGNLMKKAQEESESVSGRARQFITSGTAGQLVPDESVFRREFTSKIYSGLAIKGSELGNYLEKSVREYSGGTQTPVFTSLAGYSGDFVFEEKRAEKSKDAKKTVVKEGTKAEKERLLAVIKKNPHSPDAYKAMERLRQIDSSLSVMPPVTAPERKDRVTHIVSGTRKIFKRDEYPYMVIVPVYVPTMYKQYKAAIKIEAKDEKSYKKLKERKGMLHSVMSRRMTESNLQLVDDISEIRKRIRQSAQAASDWVCPSCVEEEPVIAGLAGL